MPAIARDISTFATLQPGVSPGGAVAGTPADQAVFMVDGGNNSSDMDGSMQSYTGAFGGDPTDGKVGGGASGVMPTPQDSVEQFKVATSGQTADFNNSSGSQVQIVTKRGTNQWRGTAYEYYLDNTFSGNPWQYGSTLASKAISHYNRFGASAGGAILPYMLGGKTYLFVNYEGYRFPAATSIERVVPTPAFENGNITFGCTLGQASTCTGGFTAAQIKAADPRGLGLNTALQKYWLQYEPQYGTTYAGGNFDASSNGCGSLSSTVTCDGINERGYIGKVLDPQTSNFVVARLDHDFGSKQHFMISWRNFKLVNLTTNQVDFGQYFAGDGPVGTYTAIAPRPQQPWYMVTSLTTNLTPTFTNTFHYSYLRNFWSWGDKGSPPPTGFGFGGTPEPGGESSSAVLAPITIAAQSIRTRFWDGHDHFIADDLTKLKGNHLIQFGGQFQHNFNYHQRTDNGSTLDYYQVFQLGESGSAGQLNFPGFNAAGIPASAGANQRLLAMNTGMITDNQVLYTRSASSTPSLALNPPLTPGFDKTTILFFNGYVSDTWKARPSLTVNYGLGYAYERPPVEANGSIVTMVDAAGKQVTAGPYLAAKSAAAALGQSYNPEIGFALVGNTANGGNKYPINPFHGALSPRISLAWSPKVENKFLRPIMGESGTVIRGGYGRVYGRLNGVGLVLTTLLGPGLLQGVDCQNQLSPITSTGGCGTTSNDTTVFRLGAQADGTSPAAPAATQYLPQPFYPGYNGTATAIPQSLDPSLRPSSVDSFNFTIQRQLSRKTLLEVGYIGRIIKNEVQALNIDSAPYMLSVGGQSFSSAYLALEQAFGCTVNISTCLANSYNTGKPGVYPAITAQPFFETALGGPTSAYCSKGGYANCTTAVMHNEVSNIASQKVWQIFKDLDAVGIAGAPRNLTDTPIPGSANGGNGQITGGAELLGSYGYGNYNALFSTFKLMDYHGLTLSSTFTYSKALGLYDSAQSSSGLIPNDSYDLRKSYGVQTYNQKFIGSIYGAFNTPWFKKQEGLVGRLAGGWNIAPVFAYGSGTPRYCSDNSSLNEAFGGGSGSFASGDNEQCVITGPRPYSEIANRGITGGVDPVYAGLALPTVVGGVSTPAAAVNVATAVLSKNQAATEVNAFTNPVGLWDIARPPILGMDEHNSGAGVMPGLRYWNLDMQVRKSLRVWERGSLEFSAISTNVLNHLVLSNGTINLASPTTWGVITSQGNSPRNVQLGIRATY